MDSNQGSTSVESIRGRMAAAVTVAAVLLAAFLLSLGVFGTARADTDAAYWAVCPVMGLGCDATSIQAAVDMAGDGDVIRVVGNSTYAENVVITKSLTLLGGCANAACNVRVPGVFVTTIDGSGAGRVVTIEGESDPVAVTVDGFTITGGDADAAVQHANAGGGVGSWNANLTLMRNVITDNVASGVTAGYGGGVYALDGSVVISYNQVLNNHAAVKSAAYGGGIYLNNVEGEVANNLIRNNVGNLGTVTDPVPQGKGAGLYITDCDPLTLAGNTIYSNTAALAGVGSGGGVYADDSHLIVDQNAIRENVANADTHNGYGGGVYVRYSEIALSHNWILSNTASGAGWGQGGGMYAEGVTVTMAADTVMYNRATLGPAAAVSGDGVGLYNGSTMTATNVVVARNQSPSTDSGEAFYVNGTPMTSTLTLVNSSVISNSNATYGLYCFAGAGSVHLRVVNSILWGNGNEVVGNCTSRLFAYSDIEDLEDDGPGVIHQDPGFVDPQNDDFHLNADSPCIDVGAAPDVYSFVPAVDWDGDTRPALQGYDIGADEVWAYVYLPLVLKDD
jgi:hypothetical protein